VVAFRILTHRARSSTAAIANLRYGLRKVELRELNLCGFEQLNPHARAAGLVAGLAISGGRGATKIHEISA
jgi:hypothetical protein